MTEKQDDNYWFNEILRIEKENPYSLRTPDDERDLSFTNSLTEEQTDDYYMIHDREKYLDFIESQRENLSADSFEWLYRDLPSTVVEEYRVVRG